MVLQLLSNISHHTQHGFKNPSPEFKEISVLDFLKWKIFEGRKGEIPDKPKQYHFNTVKNDGRLLRQNTNQSTITWIGHSTLLIQTEGLNILTDPIWSERCSPVPFAGPKRHVAPGVAFENLPPIDVVIISHNHYDHLDKKVIKKLGNKPLCLVPLGVGKQMKKWGIERYKELDWWNSIKVDGLEFVCTPAQHFSGRTAFDRNKSLWCSWVLRGKSKNLYFAGDSGYFSGFQTIGEQYGPFDVAAIPIGAYMPRWFMAPVHVDPQQAVQVFLDVKAKNFIPIHWGTFDLADEALDAPPKELLAEINKRKLDTASFWILKHGETKII